MGRRAVIHKLNDYTYCIDDAGESCCYVVCGNKKAAVIDTVNGKENLKEVVREITELPLVVINTHGHCDHIYGNVYFEDAYVHPDDVALYNAHFAMKQADRDAQAGQEQGTAQNAQEAAKEEMCVLHTVTEGEVVDLGGVKLEVIGIKGHTRGSIALLDKTSGYFFTGDAINKGQFWMQLSESTSLREYARSLEALAPYRPYIKELHGGHSVAGYEPEFIDVMLKGIRRIIDRSGEGDGTLEWFGGCACTHELGDGTLVLYTKDKLHEA